MIHRTGSYTFFLYLHMCAATYVYLHTCNKLTNKNFLKSKNLIRKHWRTAVQLGHSLLARLHPCMCVCSLGKDVGETMKWTMCVN